MKKVVYSMFGVFLCFMSTAQTPRQKYEATITAEDLRTHLTYIASDELEGRDTGSEGQRKAAAYIVNHLEKWGLEPIVPTSNGKSYYQNFNLYQSSWGDAYIKVGKKKKEFFKDYIPSGFVNVPQEKEYETVFVGYGIKDDKNDDFKGKDVKGKAVVFLSGAGTTGDKTWEGAPGSRRKIKAATDAGAVAVFEISTIADSEFKTLVASRKAILTRNSRMSIEKSPSSNVTAVPTFTVSKEMGAELVGIKASKIGNLIAGNTLKTKSVKVAVKSERVESPVPTSNVMGFIEGTDRKDEVVVISAHYDHVGVDEKGQIYNGADDDGSGTCAIMEMAEAFAMAKKEGNGPRRSMLFLWVTAEEKGLLGSQYFTDFDPVIPLSKIMANLNVDMIGRKDKKHDADDNYVYVIGSDKLSSELHAISEKMNKETVNIELDYEFNDPKDPNRFYYRSDHYNFAKNNIPISFYFTGVHEDYHQPGDDVDKILFPAYTKRAKLVFNTAWELVNIDKRIVVDSNKP